MSDWADYAEALRRIAAARETASRRQEQLASERGSRVAAATAAVSAVAKGREQMERRLDSLDELTVAQDGPRAEISTAPVSSFEDVTRAAAQLRSWLIETAEALTEARRREFLARRRLLRGGLLVLAATTVAVIVVGGPWWLGFVVPAAVYGFFRLK